MNAERWRPIPGFDGYEVSDKGRVLSRKRLPWGRLMSTPPGRKGYRVVQLWAEDGSCPVVKVHKLVLLAFIGERPDGLGIRHLDGDANNNTLTNLRYGTAQENSQDALHHGTHYYASRTHCKWGHEWSVENTSIQTSSKGRPYRQCRTCNREREQGRRRRSSAVAAA